MNNFEKDPRLINWDISQGINNEIISFSQDFGEFLCDLNDRGRPGRNAISNSQIRNFFGEVKRIQMSLTGNVSNEKWNKSNVKSSFLLLKPKLAYATGRAKSKDKNTRMENFMKVIYIVIDKVNADQDGAEDRFMKFVDFFESILAFHKAFGGKEN